jgi:hypothetical protein
MKLDVVVAGDLADAGRVAARAEKLECDGIMLPEVAHDPFLPATIMGDARTVAAGIADRYGGVIDRIQLGVAADNPQFEPLLDDLRTVFPVTSNGAR